MNCADFQDNVVACLEELLDAEQSRRCQAHLDTCAACRAEYASMKRLQGRLVASGQAAAGVSLVEPVMRRIDQMQRKPERTSIMNTLLKHRWSFGFGAVASAAAASVLLFALATPRAQAKAEEILARGARAIAKLTSIHLRGQLRTLPADNFSYISAESELYPIELWKQFEPDLKWRIEKPGRVAVMDGQQTLLYIKPPAKMAFKVPVASPSAFDTDWLHRIANLSQTIEDELRLAKAKGWKLGLSEERAADGRLKEIVTVEAKSGLPENDYMKDKFFETADTRRTYRFDAQTERLEAVQITQTRDSAEVKIFELSQIDYGQPIDQGVWQLELPADVNWHKEPQKLANNEQYTSMTAEQAARAFFEACAREDWTEAGKFMSPLSDTLKEYLGGLQIVSLSNAFTSAAYPGKYVPYEIKLRPQEVYVRVSNANRAKRFVITGILNRKMELMQDLKWSTEPEMLPNHEAYAKLSPAEAVRGYADAESKMDWNEMKKFAPAYDVENDRGQAEMAKKLGFDVSKMMPVVQVGETTWSAEQSAYLVKCIYTQKKCLNLGLRKDNASGRWQVDGGI